MKLDQLYKRIIQRVNINLREFSFNAKPFVDGVVSYDQLTQFYGFYGITSHHPLDFEFSHSNLSGSYFLGKCSVINSILYKSDIRGDELKEKGTVYQYGNFSIPLDNYEGMRIENSFLIKTLVHNYSHDPEMPEKFPIYNTIAMHYANIHGAPMDGSFLEPFATVDLTTTNDCIVGSYSYVQVGELNHFRLAPGTVWVRSKGNFNFLYKYPAQQLKKYIEFTAGEAPKGLLIDFIRNYKDDFQRVFETVGNTIPVPVPETSSVDRFAAVDSETTIQDNVLVAQRALLQNAWMGKGANAQENCFIINSRLSANDITAHGAKIINCDLGETVFVGFNSFIRGGTDKRLSIGAGCIIMPHTILDVETSFEIPPAQLVWGLITCAEDLKTNSIPLEKLKETKGNVRLGEMYFEGDGEILLTAFHERILHILEANGAFFDGNDNKGHAQQNQNISYNTIQPYPSGDHEGMYPAIIIKP